MSSSAIVTYSRRFQDALGTLCTDTPPIDMCRAWLDADDESLQEWVLNHSRLEWAQGIGVIDAARVLADQSEEGRPELVTQGVERLLRAVRTEPLATRMKARRRIPKSFPAGVTEDDFWEAWHLNMVTTLPDDRLHLTNYYDYSDLAAG